jgi:hypothetical protein
MAPTSFTFRIGANLPPDLVGLTLDLSALGILRLARDWNGTPRFWFPEPYADLSLAQHEELTKAKRQRFVEALRFFQARHGLE